MKRIVTIILTLLLLIPLHAVAQTYTIDPAHTSILFRVKNLGFMNVNGAFEKFKGTVDIDETDITKSKADVTIEINSINTGIGRRDNHLRSSDFFDAVKFPVMTFVTTKVESGTDKGKLKVIGNLTIKGVTRLVVLDVESPKNQPGNLRWTAATTVNRQDFGVSYGGTVSDEVFISINTELTK